LTRIAESCKFNQNIPLIPFDRLAEPKIFMKLLRILFLVILIILLSAAGFCFWTYRELHTPVAHTKAAEYIEIPRGASPSEIINKLAAEGVIKRSWPVLAYLNFIIRKRAFVPVNIAFLAYLAARRASQTRGRRTAPQPLHSYRRLDALGYCGGNGAPSRTRSAGCKHRACFDGRHEFHTRH
jgi:hypothetical protein